MTNKKENDITELNEEQIENAGGGLRRGERIFFCEQCGCPVTLGLGETEETHMINVHDIF